MDTLVQARIPAKLNKEIEERIKSGFYSNKSEVVRDALRKMFAENSREILREIARKSGISEKSMLKELKRVRGKH